MTKPTIITRAQWNARAPKGEFVPMTRIQGVVVHHTAGAMPQSKTLAIEEMQAIQRYHQRDQGWVDIAYNYLIDGAGRIYEGRGLGFVGAHTPGKNASHVGIALMGFFHAPQDMQPADAALAALTELCRWLRAGHDFAASEITAHRDHRATACPGDHLYNQLGRVRDASEPGEEHSPEWHLLEKAKVLIEEVQQSLKTGGMAG